MDDDTFIDDSDMYDDNVVEYNDDDNDRENTWL